MVESKLLGRKSEKKNFFGPKPLKTRLSPKLLEIERSKSVFRLLACFSTKMLKIAYKKS